MAFDFPSPPNVLLTPLSEEEEEEGEETYGVEGGAGPAAAAAAPWWERSKAPAASGPSRTSRWPTPESENRSA